MNGATRVLAVRLDNDGDVLLTGPALRALRAGAGSVDLLAAPGGEAAARLLPAVDEVLVFDPPWSGYEPAPVRPEQVDALVERLSSRGYDEAVIFTSFHQSPLPMALLARLAGIGRVAGTSEDYPGSLLDVRHRRRPDGRPDDGGPAGGHEVEAALALAAAAGYRLPPGDDGALRLRRPLPGPPAGLPESGYVVLHPGASVPSRALTAEHAHAIAHRLLEDGWPVVVTGGPAEVGLARAVAAPGCIDMAGRTTLGQLAAVLQGAVAVVVGNTGPAHLAAAVGTPVVSLFAPVVPAARWAPWSVPCAVLGDQQAACRGSRARDCPIPGHPCVSGVSTTQVSSAVRALAGDPAGATAGATTRAGSLR